ncbi:MAG: EAL domain-containing protein [Acidobacteriaceae bacterium]
MASSTKSVEGWSLPRIVSAEQIAIALDSFAGELRSSLDLDLKYAAAIRSITAQQRRHLQEIEKQHWKYLLSPLLEKMQWRRTAEALGKEHAQLGVPVQWISESYRLFARHMTAYVASLHPSAAEFRKFCSQLTDRLFYDLSMQSVAYANTVGSEYFEDLQPELGQLPPIMRPIEEMYSGPIDFPIGAIKENSQQTGLYRALMSAAELVIRAQNERELLDETCRLLVDSKLFSQVWIARPNLAGDLEIESIFSTMQLKQFRCLPNVYTGDEDRVLAVRAWRQSKIQYSNDRVADPASPAIESFYREHDLHATAVVPLHRDGDLWALLALISHDKDIFNPELLELLERIGRLIGHGLDALDMRQILEEERQHQSWLARHDTLTDVLNRRGIIERVDEAVSRARRHKKQMAVVMMDLDGFKSINDMHGHPAGDLLLRTLADRLQATLRQTDAVGRLGSDEFVLILEDLDHEDDLSLMLSRVQAAIEVPIYLANGRTLTMRSRMGVTLFPADDASSERLLRHADRALYAFKESKEEPERRWVLFEAKADEQKFLRRKTILALFRAGNIRVHYQPVIDLQNGTVTGIEALARLADNDGSLLPPAEFLPQLSAADLSTLTRKVMEQSIHDLERLDRAGFVLDVGVNFDPATLADPKAVEELCRQVQQSGIDPSRFVMELLERADTLSMAGSQEALRELKTCGARIALDDVGSAYSSLLRVKELPVDMIKLDRSFLIGLEQQPKELRFLMNMVHLARDLGMDFVAEGIECTASGDALAALGVRHAQGYAIARPMGIEDLLKWLKRHKAVPWTQPTSILGAVALQVRELDASGRILEQRPSLLQHLLPRDPNWEREVGAGIRERGAAATKLSSAYRAWHQTVADLSSDTDGPVDLLSFQVARSAYEDQMFHAALDAHQEAS